MTSPRATLGRATGADAVWPAPGAVDAAAFGVRWTGPLPGGAGWAASSSATDGPAVEVRTAPTPQAHQSTGELLWRGANEGGLFEARRTTGGTTVMTHGVGGTFSFEAAVSRLTVEPGHDRLATARVLLDSAMFTVSLLRGTVMLHAAAVAGAQGVIAVVGASGRGKSSLAAALRAHGLAHVTDDILALDRQRDVIVGHPGPPVVTVPISNTPQAGEVTLATIGPERWVNVAVASGPLPIAAVVELTAPRLSGTQLNPDVVPLLPHVLSVPPERARDRFVMLAELCEQCPIIQVPAHSHSPEALANDVLARLGWSEPRGE